MVVDDESASRAEVMACFAEDDFSLVVVAGLDEAREVLLRERVDLVLINIGLCRADEFALLGDLRRKTDAGVILLADCGGTLDGVCGLEMGADDCVAMPFHPRELRARVRNLVARTRALRQMGGGIAAANSRVCFRGWEFDLDRRQLLSPRGEVSNLTGGEFALLAALTANPGRVLNREWLLEQISSKDLASTSRSVDVCIAQLRRKLADDPRHPALITTVHGVGYRFSTEVN